MSVVCLPTSIIIYQILKGLCCSDVRLNTLHLDVCTTFSEDAGTDLSLLLQQIQHLALLSLFTTDLFVKHAVMLS